MPYDLSPVSGSHDPKYKRKKAEWDKYMEPDSFKKILKMIKENPANELNRERDYMMFVLMGNLGLRVGELTILKKKHFKIAKENPIRVRLPVLKKRGDVKVKMICIHEKVLNCTNRYMKRLMLGDDNYLFESDTSESGHVTDRTVRNTFYHYVRAVGLEENLSPHSLRHMYGMLCWKYTKDSKWVQMQLAHSDRETTDIYKHVTTEEMTEYMNKMGCIL